MKIANDQITLTAEDFDGLSDFAKKSLGALFPTATDEEGVISGGYATEFSTILSNYVSRAKDELKTHTAKSDPVTDSILAGLASADEAKLAEAAPILASLDALLNPKK